MENVIKKTCFKKLGYNFKHLFGDKKISLFKKKNVELKRLYPKNLKGGVYVNIKHSRVVRVSTGVKYIYAIH
mgnify:CR=1 FL=1